MAPDGAGPRYIDKTRWPSAMQGHLHFRLGVRILIMAKKCRTVHFAERTRLKRSWQKCRLAAMIGGPTVVVRFAKRSQMGSFLYFGLRAIHSASKRSRVGKDFWVPMLVVESAA